MCNALFFPPSHIPAFEVDVVLSSRKLQIAEVIKTRNLLGCCHLLDFVFFLFVKVTFLVFVALVVNSDAHISDCSNNNCGYYKLDDNVNNFTLCHVLDCFNDYIAAKYHSIITLVDFFWYAAYIGMVIANWYMTKRTATIVSITMADVL